MIKADIPQDVTEYREQFFFGLTIRQFVCALGMIVLAALTFLIGSKFVTTDILVYIVIFEVSPLAAVGFMRYNGMPFERIAATVSSFYFGEQRRKMKYLPNEIVVFDEVRKLRLAELEKERAEEKKLLKRRRKTNG